MAITGCTEVLRTRDSNIELLRCLLMFMIVIVHITGHNIMDSDNPVQLGEKNWWWANFLESLSEPAVNCFVLISGYYTIKLSFKKIVVFLLPILFYEVLLSLLQYRYYHEISITPFHYWFVRIYFGLMLLSPLLNIALKYVSKNQLATILILLLLFYSVFSTPPLWCLSGNEGRNMLIFIMLYLIGYYIRHYYEENYSSGIYLLTYILLCVVLNIETYLLARIGRYAGSATLSYNYDNILVILMAISLFLFFSKLHVKSRFINYVARSAFFVYIISENDYVWPHPYGLYDLLDVQTWNETSAYPLLVVGAALSIFSVCIVIDKLRLLLFGKIEQRIGSFLERYLGKLFINLPHI